MIGLLYIIHACVNKVTVKPATKHKLNDMAVLQEHYLQKNLHFLTTFLLSLLFLHVRFCNNMTLFHLLFFYFSQNYLFARYSALVRNKERQRDKQPTANSSASAGTIIVCLPFLCLAQSVLAHDLLGVQKWVIVMPSRRRFV